MPAFVGKVGDRFVEADSAALAVPDPVEDLRHRRGLREAGQLDGQVLLQGLAVGRGSPLQASVYIVGEVTYQDVRHAYIMQALIRERNLEQQVGSAEPAALHGTRPRSRGGGRVPTSPWTDMTWDWAQPSTGRKSERHQPTLLDGRQVLSARSV